MAEILNRRGVIVLISDLLAPLEDLGRELGKLRARGHEVYLFQILDPLELKLDFDGPLILQDMETEIDLHVDPQKLPLLFGESQRTFRRHPRNLHCKWHSVSAFVLE